MLKHPRIVVPDVGEVDHAWDLLGDWQVTMLRDDVGDALHGTVTWTSWESGVLDLPGDGGGQPALHEALVRVSAVQHAAAGGGALTFLVEGPAVGPLLATLWPGELQLTGPAAGPARYALRARRSPDYYRAKYPRVAE